MSFTVRQTDRPMYKHVESSVVTPIGYHKSTQVVMKAEERKDAKKERNKQTKKEKVINLTKYYVIKVMNSLERVRVRVTDLNLTQPKEL